MAVTIWQQWASKGKMDVLRIFRESLLVMFCRVHCAGQTSGWSLDWEEMTRGWHPMRLYLAHHTRGSH